MESVSSKVKQKVGPEQEQVTTCSPEDVVAGQSQPQAAGDETFAADNFLPGLENSQLPHIIDFDHGLSDELISVKFKPSTTLDGHQLNGDDAARLQLIDDVIKASAEQQERFLSALDNTQQSHVTNYIRNNGCRPADADDDWPLFNENDMIVTHRKRLIELIDIECGLLDEMISASCLNLRQIETISAHENSSGKTSALLNIMRRKSVADFKRFIDCLEKTKQGHVVPLLDPSATVASRPLSKQQLSTLTVNHSALVELIDTRHSRLLVELCSVNCLTSLQKEYIESADTASASTRRLLTILRRSSQSDYENFISCLSKTGQQIAANVLSAGATISPITAHGNELDRNERELVKAFTDLLGKIPADQGERLLIEAARALGPENELLFIKKTRSITLFIASRSLSGLMYLHDMFLNTRLKSIFQQIFSELLDKKQGVIIDELVWDRLDHDRCVKHISGASFLSVYSKIHQYSSDITTEPPVCSFIIDRLPHKVVEILLMKVAGQLFASKAITTNAATYTVVNVCAVCRYWWQTLTRRRSNAWQLRRYFTHLCRPFRFNPRLVTPVNFEGRRVNCVIAFDGKLYVATGVSNTIDVYDLADSSSYVLIERIRVPGLSHPMDLVVCRSTRCLFVADYDARCIWRISLLSDSNVISKSNQSPFITYLQYIPYSLSAQLERLLVTACGADALYVYNTKDVERSQRVNLPNYMFAIHAVETSRGTFVVAHVSERTADTQSDHTGVSELSADGHVLLVYKGSIPFNWPYYITTVDGHFLVSDKDNHQIVHLNTQLELTQPMITEFSENPVRLCYSHETRMLYVTHESSRTITVFNI